MSYTITSQTPWKEKTVNLIKVVLLVMIAMYLTGCFFTKAITVPMRGVGAMISGVGAVISVIPVAGNIADDALEEVDDAIDEVADTIDKVPI
tara:strand:- start:374 stop:649 length:276 start_codon:yes stop_codon:yes gene_type:complete